MNTKTWTNHWVCDPAFLALNPLPVFHKEHDKTFSRPPHEKSLENVHTLFRQKFAITSTDMKEDAIFLDISADDCYKLYINETFVTQGPANSYHFCYPYQHVNITDYLHEGENIIALHVYYHGRISRSFNSGDYRQGLIAEIWSGDRQILGEHWKCTRATEYSSNIVFAYDTQFNEIIDNRSKLADWKSASCDDSSWENAPLKMEDDHTLVLQEIPNLEFEQKYPVSIQTLPDGYLLDFGKDLTGTFYMKALGQAGDEVQIYYSEELLTPNQVRSKMRCNCDYEDKLILADGLNELDTYDYKCFRYVQLTTTSNVELSDFRVDYRHYPFGPDITACPSADPLVKSIWEICQNAVENCCQEAFLDCPQREKGQYLGDLTVTAHSLYCLTGDTKLFKKALQDFAHSTVICKGMMAVAPGNFMQEIADFSLLFPYQLLLYYKMTQDKEFLKSMLPIAEGIDTHFASFQAENGLLENVKDKWNLVDWPENLRDDYDFVLRNPVGDGCHNVINALYIGMKQCIEEIKDLLGIPHAKESIKLRTVFQDAFFCKETGLFRDSLTSTHSSLHANVFASFYHLQPEDNQIVSLIREKGFCCGVYTAYFVLYALLGMGEKELAYELIINKSEHSWYQMLQEGATTAFEAWGKDQKRNTSLCHSWASAPIPILLELKKMESKNILE